MVSCVLLIWDIRWNIDVNHDSFSKGMNMLDEQSQIQLVLFDYYRDKKVYTVRLLKLSNLSHRAKHYIAYYGTEDDRWELIKNHELDVETMRCIRYKATFKQVEALNNKLRWSRS